MEKHEPIFSPMLDGEVITKTVEFESGEEYRLGFSNPDAENGYDNCRGALSWLNSAAVTIDPENDAVYFTCSVGDPRGAFCFTVRRIPGGENAGKLIIHMPYPGEGMAHMDTIALQPGTLEVVGNFADEPDEEESEPEAEDDGRCEECGGRGTVTHYNRSGVGNPIEITCSACKGSGFTGEEIGQDAETLAELEIERRDIEIERKNDETGR